MGERRLHLLSPEPRVSEEQESKTEREGSRVGGGQKPRLNSN